MLSRSSWQRTIRLVALLLDARQSPLLAVLMPVAARLLAKFAASKKLRSYGFT